METVDMDMPMTCKELAEILLRTPDKPVMIAKAEVEGNLEGVWMESHREYLEKKYIKNVTLKDGTEAIILDDDPWV